MNDAVRCPECSSLLKAGSGEGLCARCLLAAAQSPAAADPKRRSHGWLYVTAPIGLLILATLGIGWIASERAIHPAASSYAKGFDDFPSLHPQQANFESRTHARIDSRFFPGARRSTIVLSHGYGDDLVQMLPYADFLVRQGFSVLTYDMRSRGRSTGDAVTMGSLETLDLLSAVDYLTKRPDVDPDRIGALGLSLGASATILAAARDSRIRAVVDDSGFSDAPAAIRSSFQHFIGLPQFPFAPLTAAIVRLRTGIDVNRIRPVDVIGQISPRPLLIVHCENDKTLPPDNSERNFAAAKEPKRFWRISGCGHTDGLVDAGAEYERQIGSFFRESFR
ncbi:MAG TPA: alpha/beta hydrolase [Verrucomicrobiae bacterium]|nr:alpha/beta hydrolase [Verrucomicrobiae bacterium]